MYSTNQKDNARVKVCIGVYCSKISTHSTCMVACTTDKTEIWLSPSAKQCWNPCSGVYCSKISTHSTCMVACTTDKTEIWLSPSAKQCWNPCSGSPPVHLTIWVHTMIGLLKKPLSICQSGWKEIWTHF